jgi:outer membrane cobalamin receptor
MKPTYFMFLAGVFAATLSHAQIKGKIIEISKEADTTVVPGVVLTWDNTTIGATSDENGNFSLDLSEETKKLIIQATGYEKQTLEIKDASKFLLLTLKSGVILNEVEIVFLSSGIEISYLNPIKMEIINERSLMKAACCNLSESFETNPSVDVNFSDAVSGAKQIQMLGLSGQYAQITKENMPYLRGLANNYGLMFIPGTWIQSIQLSKGAGSVINGYESFTGQINTELQNPEKSDKLNFNTYVNENGRNEYNLNGSRRLNQNWAVGLLNHVSFNPLVQDYNKDGFADIPTGRQYNFMNKYAYNNPNNGFEAQFGGAYLKDERKGGQFAELLPNNYPGFPPFEISLNNEKWEVYSKTGYVFKKNPGTSMGLQLSYLDHDQNNSFDTSGYRGRQKTFYANYIYQGIMGNTSNTYKIGASYLNDDVKENYKMSHYYRNESVAGVFVEYAKNYKEKFNMVAGLRADHHNFYGLFFTPRLHLRYAITPNNVLRLSVGKALRTANVFADNASLMATSRVWSIETSDLSMPYGLKPESAWNYGINFTKKFKINYREAYVTLDAYRTDFVNQIVTDVDNDAQKVLIYNLNGSSYSNTFQFEFNVEPRKRLFVKTAYRFVDTKMTYKEGLLQKPLVSMHRAFINFSYETKNSHWQFDFTTQYNGSKRLPGTETNPIEYQRANFSPDYFNLLGQITYLTKIKNADFNIYLGVENLLNYKQTNPILAADVPRSKYFDASMIWGPVYGRMLYLGLRLKIK